jgi:hypothetical protein
MEDSILLDTLNRFIGKRAVFLIYITRLCRCGRKLWSVLTFGTGLKFRRALCGESVTGPGHPIFLSYSITNRMSHKTTVNTPHGG